MAASTPTSAEEAWPYPPGEQDILRDLRARSYAEGGVFWVSDDELAVFDPDAAQQINALNFSDLALPDKLGDLLRGRTGKPFYWKQIRAAWTAQMRRLSGAEGIGQLAARMSDLLDERLDRPLDLVWAAQEVCARALVPVVVAGLGPAGTARVLRDQTFKIDICWSPKRRARPVGGASRHPGPGRRRARWCAASCAAAPGGAGPAGSTSPIRSSICCRSWAWTAPSTRSPECSTAIAGPPGAAAACLLYELTRRPDWAARLAGELAPIPPAELYAAPTRVAPVAYRFVKEIAAHVEPAAVRQPLRPHRDPARRHSASRPARAISSVLHPPSRSAAVERPRDLRSRPLAPRGRGRPRARCYVPFGWSPRACIGACLGTAQLILLCQLMCTRYRIQLADPEAVRIALVSVPLPRNFRGTITRR